MLCIASFIVLAILSIFSARFRPLVKEAFDCVTRRVTFRACDTGFDVKVRSTIVTALMTKSPKLAKFFNTRFEMISWLFVASFLVSLLWTGRGLYLYWSTGSCNGLNQGGFCVLDPSGSSNEVSGTGIECHTGKAPTEQLSLEAVDLSLFPSKAGTTDKELVFIGCYSCEYTRKAYPLIKTLIEKYQPNVTFIHYPSKPEAEFIMAYDLVIQAHAPDQYYAWIDRLYTMPREELLDEAKIKQTVLQMGVTEAELQQMLNAPETKRKMLQVKSEIDKTGIYGTPTVFINDKPVVGPKPYRVYRMMLQNSWF